MVLEHPPDVSALGRTAILVVLMVSLVGTGVAAAEPAAEPAMSACTVAAEDALNAKERAQKRLSNLQQFAEDGATVDQSVIGSVSSHIDQGRLDFQTERYCDSHKHFETASEQAAAELVRVYKSQAGLMLNASSSYVSKLEQDGYRSYEVEHFEERIQRTHRSLDSAGTLSEARAVHTRSVTIREELRSLPSPTVVRVAHHLVSVWGIIAVGITLGIGALFGALIGRRLSQRSSGPGPKVEFSR